MTRPGTLWRTLRHLRWEQVLLRALLPLRASPVVAGPSLSRRPLPGPWCAVAGRRPSLCEPGVFELLGERRRLDDVGWDGADVPLLWRYHQHYFDDLNALGHGERHPWQQALVDRWIDQNPVGQGTGWAPYPTSLRITNWIKWFLGGVTPQPRWLQSLATQVRWLRGRLEWHVLGNHLFVNAKALLLAGRFFEGQEAESWTAQARQILERELGEQILSDGGQFERSPMYHALTLEDVLDLVNILRASQAASLSSLLLRLEQLAPQMHRFLRSLTHPDHTLARFNDTADDIAPSTQELHNYACGLGLHDGSPLTTNGFMPLLPSGYVRAVFGSATAILDVAPVAPDYLMAHGHADTLSFELSLQRRRVVVNGGTSRYGVCENRLLERGTSAHSTVVVNGLNSSEVWSGFRVGRRARVRELDVGLRSVSASHDGYAHLPGAPHHRRSWRFVEQGLVVDDVVTPTPQTAVARFHLAPGLRLVFVGDHAWEVREGPTCLARVEVLRGRAARGLSRFSPAFGVVLPAESLDVELVDGRASTSWSWS